MSKKNQNWFEHLPSEFYDCLAEQPAVSIERVNLDRHFGCLLIDEAAIVEVGYDILCMNTGDSLVQIDKKVISLRCHQCSGFRSARFMVVFVGKETIWVLCRNLTAVVVIQWILDAVV